MKTFVKNLYQLNRRNIKPLVRFELLYKVLLGLILIPCATFLFRLTMKVTGYPYITAENVSAFIKNPITIILVLMIGVFLTVLTIFDISTIIVIFDMSHRTKKVSVKSAINTSLKKCHDMIQPKNFMVAFLVLFLIPFLNLGIGSNVITTIRIPEFVMNYIHKNMILSMLYVVLYFLLVNMLMEWIYSLHYMILENKSFREACQSSKKLVEGHLLMDMFKIVAVQLIFAIIYIAFLMIGILLIMLIGKVFSTIKIIESLLLTTVVSFTFIILLVSSIVSNCVSYSIISATFYQHKREKNEKIQHVELEMETKEKNLKMRNVGILIIVLAFLGGCIQMYLIVTGKANINIESLKTMEVTAHRGASKECPENTMSAFIKAKELGADWIELDVQQTKDGKIVISHDSNLSRIAGINREIIDLTYEEVKDIDVGSYKNISFSGEKIPLLKDVLEFASQNNIRLNIELKPNGREIDLEKEVVDLIKEYHFEDRCIVTSQVYLALVNIKNYDDSIRTAYVTSIAIGDITKLNAADDFSLESTNATKKMIKRIHNAGKEIMVWTVNSEDNMKNMIELGVDNIITDDVSTCRKLILKEKNSDYIAQLIKWLQ